MVKNLPADAGNAGDMSFLCQEGPLEQEMATHSSILDWEIPWTEDPGGLQSMRSLMVRHNTQRKQYPEATEDSSQSLQVCQE